MDIYSFLNSRDIAEHCRKIQKEWSPLEMALIISNSNRPQSISDKHEAWRELISDYPDMPVPPVPDCYFSRGFDSLHEILLSRIAYEERVMQCFMEPAPTVVYRHRVMWSGQWEYSESIYTSFQKAWNDVVDSWDRGETPEIIVDKIFPNDEGCISICFDYDQRPAVKSCVSGFRQSQDWSLQKRSSLPAESLASSNPPHPGRYARRRRRECRPGCGGF